MRLNSFSHCLGLEVLTFKLNQDIIKLLIFDKYFLNIIMADESIIYLFRSTLYIQSTALSCCVGNQYLTKLLQILHIFEQTLLLQHL